MIVLTEPGAEPIVRVRALESLVRSVWPPASATYEAAVDRVTTRVCPFTSCGSGSRATSSAGLSRAQNMPITSRSKATQPCGPNPGRAPQPRIVAGVSSRPSSLVVAVGTVCHAEGRGFESLHPLREKAPLRRFFVAQLSGRASANELRVSTWVSTRTAKCGHRLFHGHRATTPGACRHAPWLLPRGQGQRQCRRAPPLKRRSASSTLPARKSAQPSPVAWSLQSGGCLQRLAPSRTRLRATRAEPTGTNLRRGHRSRPRAAGRTVTTRRRSRAMTPHPDRGRDCTGGCRRPDRRRIDRSSMSGSVSAAVRERITSTSRRTPSGPGAALRLADERLEPRAEHECPNRFQVVARTATTGRATQPARENARGGGTASAPPPRIRPAAVSGQIPLRGDVSAMS